MEKSIDDLLVKIEDLKQKISILEFENRGHKSHNSKLRERIEALEEENQRLIDSAREQSAYLYKVLNRVSLNLARKV